MPTRQPRTLIGTSLFVVVVGLIWVGNPRSVNAASQMPLESLAVTLPEGKRDHFLGKLREFADTYGFAIRVGHSTPDGKAIHIEAWRSDIMIMGDNPFEVNNFRISFYQNGTAQIPKESLKYLVYELKKILESIAGANVQEE